MDSLEKLAAKMREEEALDGRYKGIDVFAWGCAVGGILFALWTLV